MAAEEASTAAGLALAGAPRESTSMSDPGGCPAAQGCGEAWERVTIADERVRTTRQQCIFRQRGPVRGRE